MAQLLIVDNAIAWAHFRLRGGVRTLITLSAVVAGAIGVGLFLTSQLSTSPTAVIYQLWQNGLLLLEMILLIMAFPGRSASAVRADVSSKMLESHRMMPMAASEGVVGYLLGPNLSLLAIIVAVMALGALATSLQGIPAWRFLFSSGLIVSFGLLLATVLTFAAFRFRVGTGIAFAICIPFIIARGQGADWMPAATVICGPFIRKTVFSMAAAGDLQWPYAVSELFQLILGVLYFSAACRVYRSDQKLGFTPLMGLVFVAVIVAASIVGILNSDAFHPSMRFQGDLPETTQAIIGLLTCSLLALLPVSAAARLETSWQLRRRHQPAPPEARPTYGIPVVIAAVLFTLLLCPGLIVRAASINHPRPLSVARVAIVLLCFLMTSYWLMRIIYRASAKATILLYLFVVVWVVPPIVALVMHVNLDDATSVTEGIPGIIGSLSPPWSIWQSFAPAPGNLAWGIAFQVLLAIVAAVLFYRTEPKGRR